MHLANGALTPECVALTYGAAAAGLALATLADQRTSAAKAPRFWLAAGLGGLVFAAQMLNVTLLPGMSGHFVGGVALAWALGPALGAWTMTAILMLQAFVLGDGGVLALGANVLNMALLPAGFVALGRCAVGSREAHSIALAAALAGLAVPLAALLIALEAALFRSAGELASWGQFAAVIIGAHLAIGLFEAVVTLALLSALSVWQKADMLRPRWQPAMLGLAAGALVAGALWLPISSTLPDGYESAAAQCGMAWLLSP